MTATASPRAGALGGLVAGVVYTAYAQTVTVLTAGIAEFLTPFRQIAAVVLGEPPLAPGSDAVSAVVAGTVVHLALSVVFGIAIALVLRGVGARGGAAVIGGALLGLAIYALDVFVVFPAAFPWFLANDRVVQSVGHALFGALVGWWVRR